MSATETAAPADKLANLILMLLTPMFLWSTEGDISLAYRAAAHTVNEYRIANRLSLFTVAKIIAFDIATLSSLSQSMYEDVSILLALRLRGNANSLDRSGERNRRALEQTNRTATTDGVTVEPVEAVIAKAEQMVREAKARVQAASAPAAKTQPDADPAPEPVPAAAPAPRTPAEHRQAAWAGAMAAVAAEFATGLKDVSPDERWKEIARIKALTTAAGDLASGTVPPPFPGMAAE